MKKFKTESKKVLDLMINSIYTNKEIFLRELLSNCSDAIDKLYFKALTDNISGLTRNDFHIDISVDKENRVLTISDNGIGMTEKELEKRLDEVHITLNKNAIPNDPQSPFITSGVRIGTPAVTSRGFGKEEMELIADFIYKVTYHFEETKEEVTKQVIALCEKFPIYKD